MLVSSSFSPDFDYIVKITLHITTTSAFGFIYSQSLIDTPRHGLEFLSLAPSLGFKGNLHKMLEDRFRVAFFLSFDMVLACSPIVAIEGPSRVRREKNPCCKVICDYITYATYLAKQNVACEERKIYVVRLSTIPGSVFPILLTSLTHLLYSHWQGNLLSNRYQIRLGRT